MMGVEKTTPDRLNGPRRFPGPWGIAAIYVILGSLWILLSDRAVAALVSDPELLTSLQTLKGWFYVVSTAIILFFLIYRHSSALRDHASGLLQSRQALAENEAKFRQLAENIKAVLILWNLADGRVIYVNSAYEKIWGRSGESLYQNPRSCLESVHPEDRLLAAGCAPGPEQPENRPADFRIIDGSGQVRWMELRVIPIPDDQGRVYRQAALIEDVTERRLHQEEVQVREQQYHDLFENNYSVILLVDPATGRIVDANPAACSFYGYAREDLRGRLVGDINTLPPQELFEAMNQVQQEGQKRFQFRHRLANGQERDVEVVSGPLKVSGRALLYSIVHDITEWKKAEESRQRYFQTLIERSSDGIAILDEQGRFAYLSPSVERLMAYETRELLRTSVFDYLHPDDLARAADVFSSLLKTDGAVMNIECRFRHRDGSWRMHEATAANLLSDPLLQGILVNFRDVTERRWADEELRRLNRALATASACSKSQVHAPDEQTLLDEVCRQIVTVGGHRMVWVGFALDDDDRTVQPVAQAGFDDGYLAGLRISWGDNQWGQGPVGRAIRTGRPSVIPDIAESADFSMWREETLARGYRSSTALPLEVDDKIIGALTIYSGEVRAFDQNEVNLLSELARDLAYGLMNLRLQAAHRKTESERIRLELQLRQAQKMEAIGALAGGIAHDFNNILGAMLGYTQLALLDVPEDQASLRHYLDQVLTGGARATDLVKQILAFSRQTDHEFSLVDLAPIVKEALKLLRASLPSTIEIQQAVQPGSLPVKADPTQIHQLMMNLCTNAFHAMAESGGILSVGLDEVRIEAKSNYTGLELLPGRYQRLTIGDTGPGIPREVQDRIFEPYFTTKPAGIGTGMGLALVHGIVRSHGGLVRLADADRTGAVFEVYLPQVDGASMIQADSQTPLQKGSERILLVDDEPALVDMWQAFLVKLGYTVRAFTDSRAALDHFKSHAQDFDLVITDQTMPHVTGLALAREIHLVRPEMPVILCTGFSGSITRDTVDQYHLKGLVFKPILVTELARQIRLALD
jgi:PAS domain S-box-containing protein